MKRSYSTLRPKQGNKTSNTGWNMMMGAGGAQSGIQQLRNYGSTNASNLKSYNPFEQMLNATGADGY